MRAALIGLTAILVGLAVLGVGQYLRAKEIAAFSAAMSIHERVESAIEAHKVRTGVYPGSLEQLEIDYSRSDGATKETLRLFRYRRTTEGYELELPRE